MNSLGDVSSATADSNGVTTKLVASPVILTNSVNGGAVTLSGVIPAAYGATGASGVTVLVYDGSTQLGSTTTTSGGAWSFTSSQLTNGAHSFQVRSSAAAGVSAPSLAVSLNITQGLAPTTPGSGGGSNSGPVSVATYLANAASLDAAGSIKISDTAAAVSAALDKLNSDANVTAITLTNTPTLALTVAQALGDTQALKAVTNSNYAITVTDTGAAVEANFDALNADAKVTAILPTGGLQNLVLTIDQVVNDSRAVSLLDPFVINVTGTAAKLNALTTAEIALLSTAGTTQITATDSDLTLSVAQKAALGAAGISVVQPYSGGTTEVLSYSSTGSTAETLYQGVNNSSYSSYAIFTNSAGATTSEIWYRTDGSVYQSKTWKSDGSYSIDSNSSGSIFGASFTSYNTVYAASGLRLSVAWSNGIAETLSYNNAGTVSEAVVTGLTAANYAKTDTLYNADGSNAKETWYTSAGAVYEIKTWNSDGSYALHFNVSGSVFGASYSYYDSSYNASGQRVSQTWSNGVTETWSYNSATGSVSETVVTGLTNKNFVKTDTLYGSNAKPASETWYRADGSVLQKETWNADGSYEIHSNSSGSAFGANYSSYDMSYNSLSQLIGENWSNGAAETWTYSPSTGLLTEAVVVGITNPLYVKTDTYYGATGKPASETWYRNDGTIYQTEVWNSNGTTTIHKG